MNDFMNFLESFKPFIPYFIWVFSTFIVIKVFMYIIRLFSGIDEPIYFSDKSNSGKVNCPIHLNGEFFIDEEKRF